MGLGFLVFWYVGFKVVLGFESSKLGLRSGYISVVLGYDLGFQSVRL